MIPTREPSRAVFASICIALVGAVACFYARGQIPAVLVIVLSDGLVAALWVASATLLGFAILRLVRVDAPPLLTLVTAAGVGLGIFSLAMFGFSLAGKLTSGLVFGFAVTGCIPGLIILLRGDSSNSTKSSRAKLTEWLHAPVPKAQWIWLLAMPFLAMSVVGACILPGLLWRPDDPHPYDVLEYHLQVPREWYEAGRMIPLHHNVFSYFPFNAEMHFLASMYLQGGPWAGMYSAQFMSAIFAVLAVVAIYAGARSVAPADQDQNSAPLAAALTATLPWIVMISSVAYVESLLILYVALAIVWALRSIDADSRRPIIIAGLMAGFAAGVKLTAIPMLLCAVPIALLVAGVRAGRNALMRILVSCVLFFVIGMVVVSPWLVRNAVWTGNPLFPLAMRTLGAGHFDVTQVERFERAHSPVPEKQSISARLGAIESEVLFDWQYGYVLWPLAIIGAIQQRKRRQSTVLLLVLLAMLICWVGWTHLISRFFILAVPIAALLAAQIRWGKFAWLGATIVVASAITAFPQLHQRFEPKAEAGRNGVFGLKDMSLIAPEVLSGVEQQGNGLVVMAGDVQAFLHQIPMSRLRYRTVFDLKTQGVDPSNLRQVLSAWAGQPLESLPPLTSIYVDPAEMARLAGTYYKVPALPAPNDRPFVVDAKQVP